MTRIVFSLHSTGARLPTWLVVAFFLVSCTHLHDPADAALSDGLATAFADATKHQASLYSAMLENQEHMEAKEQLRLAVLTRERAAAFTAQVYTRTWQSVLLDLDGKKRQLQAQQKHVEFRLEEMRTRLQQLPETLAGNTDVYRQAVQLLAESAKKQNLWFARREFYRRSMVAVADITVARQAADDFDTLQAFNDAGKVILDTEIPVVDASGDSSKEKAALGSILEQDDRADTDSIGVHTDKLLSPASPPGIRIIILGLAADLAESELHRARLESGYLKALVKLLSPPRPGGVDRLQDSIDMIEEAEIILRDRIAAGHMAKTDRLLATLNAWRGKSEAKTVMPDLLKVIGIYAMAMTSAEPPLQLQLAMLDHQYSIQLSAVNARQHETLISRGLQGLAAYHQGGIKPETVANFLRAAQAIGLGVIGAGVL